MTTQKKNIKLILAYDGSEFLGWQDAKQGPSIELALTTVIEKILQHKVILQAASRTDAGVHAQGQVVNFFSEKNLPHLEKLLSSFNALLPPSIRIKHIELALPDFHPTLDVKSKEYHYEICFAPQQDPRHRFYSWHYPHYLDIDAMRKAANYLSKEHDFASFCNAYSSGRHKTTIRTIHHLTIDEIISNERIIIKVNGNNFLFRMVRNLAGTLAYIGRGKISLNDLPSIIMKKDRSLAGMTAPAHGLTLYKVFYD